MLLNVFILPWALLIDCSPCAASSDAMTGNPADYRRMAVSYRLASPHGTTYMSKEELQRWKAAQREDDRKSVRRIAFVVLGVIGLIALGTTPRQEMTAASTAVAEKPAVTEKPAEQLPPQPRELVHFDFGISEARRKCKERPGYDHIRVASLARYDMMKKYGKASDQMYADAREAIIDAQLQSGMIDWCDGIIATLRSMQ
jgi:hypothetical protein